jgi:hypothetical protein
MLLVGAIVHAVAACLLIRVCRSGVGNYHNVPAEHCFYNKCGKPLQNEYTAELVIFTIFTLQ